MLLWPDSGALPTPVTNNTILVLSFSASSVFFPLSDLTSVEGLRNAINFVIFLTLVMFSKDSRTVESPNCCAFKLAARGILTNEVWLWLVKYEPLHSPVPSVP